VRHIAVDLFVVLLYWPTIIVLLSRYTTNELLDVHDKVDVLMLMLILCKYNLLYIAVLKDPPPDKQILLFQYCSMLPYTIIPAYVQY